MANKRSSSLAWNAHSEERRITEKSPEVLILERLEQLARKTLELLMDIWRIYKRMYGELEEDASPHPELEGQNIQMSLDDDKNSKTETRS